MSIRASQKMPPSVFGRPTFRDHPEARKVFGPTYEERQGTIQPKNKVGEIVDEVLQETEKPVGDSFAAQEENEENPLN